MCDEYKKLLLWFVISKYGCKDQEAPIKSQQLMFWTEIRELNLLFQRNGLPYQEIDQLIKYPFNATSLCFQLYKRTTSTFHKNMTASQTRTAHKFWNFINQYSDATAHVRYIDRAFNARPHKEWCSKMLRPNFRQLTPLYSYPIMFNEQLYALAMSTQNSCSHSL